MLCDTNYYSYNLNNKNMICIFNTSITFPSPWSISRFYRTIREQVHVDTNYELYCVTRINTHITWFMAFRWSNRPFFYQFLVCGFNPRYYNDTYIVSCLHFSSGHNMFIDNVLLPCFTTCDNCRCHLLLLCSWNVTVPNPLFSQKQTHVFIWRFSTLWELSIFSGQSLTSTDLTTRQ